MTRRVWIAIVMLGGAAGCTDAAAPAPQGFPGKIEYLYNGVVQPVQVRLPASTLGSGMDTTIVVVTYAEGCYESAGMQVIAMNGVEATVVPLDSAVTGSMPLPCAAGLRELTHTVRIHPTLPQTYTLHVKGQVLDSDTLQTRQVVIQVR